jgi:hypothetical protein
MGVLYERSIVVVLVNSADHIFSNTVSSVYGVTIFSIVLVRYTVTIVVYATDFKHFPFAPSRRLVACVYTNIQIQTSMTTAARERARWPSGIGSVHLAAFSYPANQHITHTLLPRALCVLRVLCGVLQICSAGWLVLATCASVCDSIKEIRSSQYVLRIKEILVN